MESFNYTLHNACCIMKCQLCYIYIYIYVCVCVIQLIFGCINAVHFNPSLPWAMFLLELSHVADAFAIVHGVSFVSETSKTGLKSIMACDYCTWSTCIDWCFKGCRHLRHPLIFQKLFAHMIMPFSETTHRYLSYHCIIQGYGTCVKTVAAIGLSGTF